MIFVDLSGVPRSIRHYDEFRTLVSKGRPRMVTVHGDADLEILTEEGALEMTFPSRQALKTALGNWRSLYGLRLIVGNKTIGRVGKQLPGEF